VIYRRFLPKGPSQAEIEKQREAVRREKLEKMKKQARAKAYRQMALLIARREGRDEAIRDAGY